MNGKYWILRWTGWKPVWNIDVLAGQWLAYPIVGDSITLDRPMIVSSCPGPVAIYLPMDLFNMAAQIGQWALFQQSGEQMKETAKKETFMRLLDFMKAYIDPIQDWQKLSIRQWKEIGNAWEPPF